jgi:hypothetical protein
MGGLDGPDARHVEPAKLDAASLRRTSGPKMRSGVTGRRLSLLFLSQLVLAIQCSRVPVGSAWTTVVATEASAATEMSCKIVTRLLAFRIRIDDRPGRAVRSRLHAWRCLTLWASSWCSAALCVHRACRPLGLLHALRFW